MGHLVDGTAGAWAPILETLSQQIHREPRITPTDAVFRAWLSQTHIRGWCAIAARVAPTILQKSYVPQAVRNFETWLTMGAMQIGGELITDPAAQYRAHVDEAFAALLHLDWNRMRIAARMALANATDIEPFEARRLHAAAVFAQGDYAKGLADLYSCTMKDMMADETWQPSRPFSSLSPLSSLDETMHFTAWLFTRLADPFDDELLGLLAKLETLLPPGDSARLKIAREEHRDD